MSKRFDAYFNDLTSCSLLGFLEQKRPTEKNKAYSMYKGALVSIANDDTSKPERRAFAQACINSFEVNFHIFSLLIYRVTSAIPSSLSTSES